VRSSRREAGRAEGAPQGALEPDRSAALA
jgi:hypothetical protein